MPPTPSYAAMHHGQRWLWVIVANFSIIFLIFVLFSFQLISTIIMISKAEGILPYILICVDGFQSPLSKISGKNQETNMKKM